MNSLHDNLPTQSPIRVAILQRVCTGYRAKLFRQISDHSHYQIRLFFGDDVPQSKVKSAQNLDGFAFTKTKSRFFTIGKRTLVWHSGLQNELTKFNPDVVVTEGESNFLNLFQVFNYRRSNPHVKIIHWSLGSIPGNRKPLSPLIDRLKYLYQQWFDGFLVYSSYGKKYLESLGHPPKKIVVAVNVADTNDILFKTEQANINQCEIRKQLNLHDQFTVLYSGALTANKRPDLLIEIAKQFVDRPINFVFIGDGSMLDSLKAIVHDKQLAHVYLIGPVHDTLSLYYQASDVVVLPGRGGVVISEAMAWGKPVILHQADGTEYDLIVDKETGRILNEGTCESFCEAINGLLKKPALCKKWGEQGRQRLLDNFTMKLMIDSFFNSINNVIHHTS